ncbi:50S ribosomal protein L5 [Candidatus Pacearchaeota archaeon]|nr:50S ribosomal protein L5 [Candidatus Pacearchaeota archaeon]|tara:strand:- start:524 stop:1183 length:660 start_codon:yes stop_codon:yes gene_type:complete
MEQEMENVKVNEDANAESSYADNESGESFNDGAVSEESKDLGDTKKIDNKSDQNKMREVEIEKMVLHCGGTEDKLEKSRKLLEMISGSDKIYTVRSTKRIPAFGISPGKQSGCKITIRDKSKIDELLKRFFSSMDNNVKGKQASINQFCFGIPEYIEVPGLEYKRDIGILGFEIMLVFKRKGKSVGLRKIKRGRVPGKQHVTKEEIIEYLKSKFNLEVE